MLATIGKLLAGPASQRRMLSAVLDQLERRLGIERASVRLVSPDGTELVVEATRGDSRAQGRGPTSCGEGLSGR